MKGLISFVSQDALNMVVMKDLRSNKEGIDHAVIDVQMTMKESKTHTLIFTFLFTFLLQSP